MQDPGQYNSESFDLEPYKNGDINWKQQKHSWMYEREAKEEEKTLLQKIKENIGAGIVVSLVSIPLSTALSMASLCTPMMGLSAAIYGPAVGGLIGGSDYNILGPAGALVNILSRLVNENGGENGGGQDIIPWIAMFAGIFSLLVWAFKLERFCVLIPNSVLEGFSMGVGITIGCNQLNFALGLNNENLQPQFYKNVWWSLSNIGDLNWVVFIPFLIFFLSLFNLMKYLPGRPWIILIAALGNVYGIIMNQTAALSSARPLLLVDKYPDMYAYGADIVNFGYMNAPFREDNPIPFKNIVFGAAEVAFVAVLETLISARIADTKTGTRFDEAKETMGMGIANLVTGLMGGTPCTGVLVRTGVNISSGATDKISQFMNSISVLIIVMIGMKVFTQIPMAVIAAILITSSIRLCPFSFMGQLWREDKIELLTLIATTVTCVFVDGAVGLMFGCFISLLRNAAANNQIDLKFYKDIRGSLEIRCYGTLTFINCLDFETKVIDTIKKENPSKVVFDLNRLTRIDIDGVDSIKNCQIKFKGKIFFEFLREQDDSPDKFRPRNVNVNRQIQLSQWYPTGTAADKMGSPTKNQSVGWNTETIDDDDSFKRLKSSSPRRSSGGRA